MGRRTGMLLGSVALRFDARAKLVPEDLSAAASGPGRVLYLAGDERAAIEVLRPEGSWTHSYGGHRQHGLAERLGLAPDDEVDIEGLAIEGEHDALWVCGSHSAKRKKPRGEGHARDLARLASVSRETARWVLGRIPLGADGAPDEDEIALLPAKGDRSLLGMLAEDEHLGPFLPARRTESSLPPIPGKDNGFDVEGLAWWEGRALLGLRGPVLRGWAFVLDLALRVDGAELGAKRGRYHKHALDLDGLGVRDLIALGDDLLVLAGPTMALDGAHRLFRWRGGPRAKGHSVIPQEKGVLEPLFDLPWGPGVDRAEGVTSFSWFDEDDSILVVYDSPRASRRLDERTVMADVFAL